MLSVLSDIYLQQRNYNYITPLYSKCKTNPQLLVIKIRCNCTVLLICSVIKVHVYGLAPYMLYSTRTSIAFSLNDFIIPLPYNMSAMQYHESVEDNVLLSLCRTARAGDITVDSSMLTDYPDMFCNPRMLHLMQMTLCKLFYDIDAINRSVFSVL